MRRLVSSMLIVLLLTACAPSNQAIETAIAKTQIANLPTIPPTETTIPTPTDDQIREFVLAYTPHLQEWSAAFKEWQKLHSRFVAEGSEILTEEEFQKELASSLGKLEKSTKDLMAVEVPGPEWQILRDKAEQLDAATQTFASMYRLSLLGNSAAAETALQAMNDSFDLFGEIVDDLEELTNSLP